MTRMSMSRSLSSEALDFAPGLLAIQERPPARYPRLMLLSVVALIALLTLWAMFARLDVIASAPGRLVPLTFTKVVQPAEAGVVSEILVKEGDVVREGQVLLRLDARLSRADTDALSTDVALRRLTLRRIEAELGDRPFLLDRGERPDLYVRVEGQFRARRQAFLDAVAQEMEGVNKANADLQAAQQVLAKLTQTLPTYRQSADAYRKLVQEGFVGELAAAEKTRDAMEREQDVKTQTATVESLRAGIALGTKRIVALRSQYRSQLENERMEALAVLNRSGQELEKSTVRAGMLEVKAPHPGVVKDLAVTSRGAVVAAGTLLMNVVPMDEPLQAEVLLRNEDVGFVTVGQAAKVKVAAYPFQKYGMLDGEVALLSADAADPKSTSREQTSGLAYRALVKLKTVSLDGATPGERLALSPGMLVNAEIHQGDRTVMEYLLSPVKKVGQEAARER